MALKVNIQNPENKVEIKQTNVDVHIANQPAMAISIGQKKIYANIQKPQINIKIGCGCSGNGGGGGGAQTLAITAGEDIAARDLIYIGADGLAYRADVTAIDREVIAVANAEILTGDTGEASLPGAIIPGFSALTAGTRFFVSDTPGALSEVVQPAGAVFIQQVCHAVSETSVLFRPGFPIGVASEVVETFYRLTEGGDIRITESGDFRIQE